MPACQGLGLGDGSITLHLNAQQAAALQHLASTGLFGQDVPAVLLGLMDLQLRKLVTGGWLAMPQATRKRPSKAKGR